MKRIRISEVVMRDGLQIEPRFIPTANKLELIDALGALGFERIEVTSFVSPKAVPMLADAEQVASAMRRYPGVIYTALVANLRGAERAVDAGIDEIGLVVSASEAHNQANVGRSIDTSFAGFEQISKRLEESGTAISAGIAMSFGCPLEGDIPQSRVAGLVGRFYDLGIRTISLADTTGMAYPSQITELIGTVRQRFPEVDFGMHLHDTRGLGLANVLAGVAAGIDRFDGCLGGLGGCPFAPGASGNICTEDLVHMLTLMGYDTGVDLDGLIECAGMLKMLVAHDLPGQVAKAGPRWRPVAVAAV